MWDCQRADIWEERKFLERNTNHTSSFTFFDRGMNWWPSGVSVTHSHSLTPPPCLKCFQYAWVRGICRLLRSHEPQMSLTAMSCNYFSLTIMSVGLKELNSRLTSCLRFFFLLPVFSALLFQEFHLIAEWFGKLTLTLFLQLCFIFFNFCSISWVCG